MYESTFESTSVCSCTRVQYVYFIPNEGFSGSTVTGVQLYTHGTVRVHVCLFLYGYKYTYCTYLQWPYLIFEGVSKIEYCTRTVQRCTYSRILSYESIYFRTTLRVRVALRVLSTYVLLLYNYHSRTKILSYCTIILCVQFSRVPIVVGPTDLYRPYSFEVASCG